MHDQDKITGDANFPKGNMMKIEYFDVSNTAFLDTVAVLSHQASQYQHYSADDQIRSTSNSQQQRQCLVDHINDLCDCYDN